MTIVTLARPGTFGSSSLHLPSFKKIEIEPMSKALDALIARHRARRLVVAGHSGGARLLAQILASGRADLHCAVMGSGRYSAPAETSQKPFMFIPADHTDGVAVAPSRRLFIIGDPRDEVTPFADQREWAATLRRLGHHAVLLPITAADPKHHGSDIHGLHAAALCAIGKSDAEIARAISPRWAALPAEGSAEP